MSFVKDLEVNVGVCGNKVLILIVSLRDINKVVLLLVVSLNPKTLVTFTGEEVTREGNPSVVNLRITLFYNFGGLVIGTTIKSIDEGDT